MKLIKKFKWELLIIFLFVLLRLPSLGHDTFNTDVWKWKSRSYDFGSGVFNLDFAKTSQKYHPGVTLMWLGAFGIKIYNVYADLTVTSPDTLLAIFGLHFVQKFLVVLVIGITLSFVFHVLNKLFGLKYALLTTFLIAFEPLNIALTRTFHLEGLLSIFMLCSVLWFYNFLEHQKEKVSLLLSAIFASLAILTKTSGIYVMLFIGLTTFLHISRGEKSTQEKKSLKSVLSGFLKIYPKWLGLVLVFFFVLWPALWVDTSNVLANLYRGISVVGVERNHGQIYFGSYVTNPGSFYYVIVFLLRSSIYLFAGLLGYFSFRKEFTGEKENRFSKYMLIYVFFYLLQITIPAKKLDRYILPAFLGLIPVVSWFYVHLLKKIVLKEKVKYILFGSVATVCMVGVHPDYLSYFNPVFGGLHVGVRVLEPKWLIGKNEIISYFKELRTTENLKPAPKDSSFEGLIQTEEVKEVLSVGFPEKYYTQIWPFFREMDAWATIKDLTPFAKHTKYFVYPVWEDDSAEENRFKLEYTESIKIRGVNVYNVYKAN